jgi:DNA (cytosine-5)-methyltransferase 1
MAGAIPLIGMNHWPVACESYETNHAQHGARAACVDVVTQDPRRYPKADLLLASPECTHHSYARGKKKDDPSLFDPQGDQGAERSRATMWDVVRFAEAHEYKACIVENVGAAVKWGLPSGRKLKHGEYGPLFVAWLQAMEALEYRWRVVHLNSMVCGVPQSRDRLYVVFWKKWQRAPDLDITALGWCPRCDDLVHGRQEWKRPGATLGTYGQGYVYACPTCSTQIALAVRPAAAAIDWSLPATKIGERARPLKDATMERIRRGLERLRERPHTVRLRDGLVVQVGANLFTRDGMKPRAWPLEDPMPCVTGTSDRALVLPTTHHGEGQRSKRADHEVVPTVTDGQALDTISAQGNHHGLVIANYGSPGAREGKQGWARHVDDAPVGTVTATDSHALFNYRQGQGIRHPDEPLDTLTAIENRALLGDVTEEEIANSTFRMLQPDELKLASGFPAIYHLHGNKRDQVAQVGNAVTAPAEAELVLRVLASLDEAGA